MFWIWVIPPILGSHCVCSKWVQNTKLHVSNKKLFIWPCSVFTKESAHSRVLLKNVCLFVYVESKWKNTWFECSDFQHEPQPHFGLSTIHGSGHEKHLLSFLMKENILNFIMFQHFFCVCMLNGVNSLYKIPLETLRFLSDAHQILAAKHTLCLSPAMVPVFLSWSAVKWLSQHTSCWRHNLPAWQIVARGASPLNFSSDCNVSNASLYIKKMTS